MSRPCSVRMSWVRPAPGTSDDCALGAGAGTASFDRTHEADRRVIDSQGGLDRRFAPCRDAPTATDEPARFDIPYGFPAAGRTKGHSIG